MYVMLLYQSIVASVCCLIKAFESVSTSCFNNRNIVFQVTESQNGDAWTFDPHVRTRLLFCCVQSTCH